MNLGIFDRLPTGETLSVETISTQVDDYIVPTLRRKFERLKTTTEDIGKRGNKLFKDNRVKAILNDIDFELNKRFGINFKHIYTDNSYYQAFPVAMDNKHILSNDYDIIIKAFDTLQQDDPGVKKAKEESDKYGGIYKFKSVTDTADVEKLMYNWRDSIKKIDKKARTESIHIDLNKATITNLPKDHVVYLALNPYALFLMSNLTPEEVVAVLLHEVGHAFTYLEYSYRTVKTTLHMSDALIDGVFKGDDSYIHTLSVIYEDVLDGRKEDLKDLNTDQVFIKTMTRFIANTANKDGNSRYIKNSEYVADEFSIRFGTGGDLAAALAKFDKSGTLTYIDYSKLALGSAYVIMLTVGLFILVGMLMSAAIGVVTMVMIFRVVIGGMSPVSKNVTDNAVDKYDTPKDRMLAIKTSIIRQIRLTDLPKETIKSYIRQIDTIEKLSATASGLPVTEKVKRFLSGMVSDKYTLEDIERLTEALIENDLYVTAEKFKNIKRT